MKVKGIKNYIKKKFTVNLHKLKKPTKDSINYYEKKFFSQNGEDGIIEFIFCQIGPTNKYFVEFGVADGNECNTRFLREKRGWSGLMMDPKDDNPSFIKKELVTAENIENLFEQYSVPINFDLLSIDIDGNDYYVWKAIEKYYPRVVIIEYNSSIPPTQSRVIEYDPKFKWDMTSYFGASLLALEKLASSKGYELVGCDNNGVNAFFIKRELINDKFKKTTLEELFRFPQFGEFVHGIHIGHPPSDKKMIEV